ncbi:LETM1-related biofilm-associated protein [Mangrovimonas aestuarii]|uniref:LETM1-related biofilm-associated protein n=1 Tax=Mangrovimonas aestuarii TaxID=3018443 RepID=UPI00237934F6|nr:LETM1-related biofilm-associated protein [Mangrovimonas aestuarii]
MNPSTNGWIKKLLKEVDKQKESFTVSEAGFYHALRECGFIYGSNVKTVVSISNNYDFTREEISKLNLCLGLYHTHYHCKGIDNFIENTIAFYKAIDAHKPTFFDGLLIGKNTFSQLEKIIHKRVQIDDNVITKNFNYFLTNALLYVDILAFHEFLETGKITSRYLERLESIILNTAIAALNTKNRKSKYDRSLIKLFESSLRYQNKTELSFKQTVSLVKNPIEARYALDIACMSVWTDLKIDKSEDEFLSRLGKSLNLSEQSIEQAKLAINKFYSAYHEKIPLLSSKNLVQSFYNNSSAMVGKLISRNSKRLLKELRESKELMVLITQSTVRELTDEEQKKVQEQVMDIIKSIPSLAIFILPGGAILLPLFVKFIPKLLPSAFDDNRIIEEKKKTTKN